MAQSSRKVHNRVPLRYRDGIGNINNCVEIQFGKVKNNCTRREIIKNEYN